MISCSTCLQNLPWTMAGILRVWRLDALPLSTKVHRPVNSQKHTFCACSGKVEHIAIQLADGDDQLQHMPPGLAVHHGDHSPEAHGPDHKCSDRLHVDDKAVARHVPRVSLPILLPCSMHESSELPAQMRYLAQKGRAMHLNKAVAYCVAQVSLPICLTCSVHGIT